MSSDRQRGCGLERCQDFLQAVKEHGGNGKYPRIQTLLSAIAGASVSSSSAGGSGGSGGSGLKLECRPCMHTGPEGQARAALFNGSPSAIVLCTSAWVVTCALVSV